MKKRILFLVISLIIVNIINAQKPKSIINNTSLGYFNFNKNKEEGFFIANETIYKFNKYINPGVRFAIHTGNNNSEDNFDFLMNSNSVSLNGYTQIEFFKNHSLQIAAGISLVNISYNMVIGSYSNIRQHGKVYDAVTLGYIKPGFNWQAMYKSNITKKWFLGFELSQIYTSYNMKISGLALTSGFKFSK
jgi:hypothetical protein